ncbi:MAG: class I SAM-dependent methyltransferase [Clostridia bacterium]|nr:class I SAM-dependent methyltransferase [Clostridia bacterium]
MNEAYSALSDVYERLMDGEAYKAWATRVVSVIDENSPGVLGYDLACGSGYFTRALKKAGYDVIGVDSSAQMLTEAVRLCRQQSLNIEFLRQDMTCLKSFNKVDFLTVINDGVNYVAPDKLKKGFAAFYKQLKVGGILFFDFSTPYKLKNIIGDNVFCEDYDDLSYIWFNKFLGDSVQMDLSVFKKQGEFYVKKEETHLQYVHSLDFIVGSLKAVGFKSVTANAFMGGAIQKDTQRIEILAVK